MNDASVKQYLPVDNSSSGERKAFVTGGTGLVGSHLIQVLLQENYSITALYRKYGAHIQHEKLQWLKGDILDLDSLEEGMAGVNEVYHCAAMVGFNRMKEQMYRINIDGTANVVNSALKMEVAKLCYVSSVAALGHPSGEITTEATKRTDADNRSVYGKSKHHAEMEVWRGIAEGLNAVIVNPSIVLGDSDWNVSSTKIFKAAYDEFPYFSDGVTGFVDVHDVVEAMIHLMRSDTKGERFIVSGENLEYKDVFTAIARAFDKRLPRVKINRFLSSIVWILEAVQSKFTGSEPLLTKETADAAHEVKRYDHSKLLSFLPAFRFTPLHETIERVCQELKVRYTLA